MRFIGDLKSKKTYPELQAKMTVIVPVYNEKDELIHKCVESLVKADGDKEIIIIDDCSTNNSWKKIKELKQTFPEITILKHATNKGKRVAQHTSLRFSKGDIIVTVDSDTIVKKDALVALIKPLHDKKIGATTGNVRAYNRKENLLTRMIDARYHNAFTFERQGLSSFGIVTCCSGVLSAYRADALHSLKESYINQTFLGKVCTYGDDRYLTNLMIKNGYKIAYVHDAVAYTEVPTKLKQFLKQQLRWRKSFIRESFVILPFALRKNMLLSFEILLNLVIPFLSLFARVLFIYLVFVAPIILVPLVLSIALIAILRNLLLFFEEPGVAFYSIPFAFLYELVIYWLYWIALFSLWDTGWGTR